ncbi:MAG: pyridoxamine 5'-phosphate oxidase family protein [Dehalococcoidia bacterium]|nr:pyridoxamine 5'-phosphate oxidase family protein [Dehalococcoidia bacterium]
MPSRRNEIAMTDEERLDFLEHGATLQVASIGHDGWPHMVAMWYAMIDGDIHFTTYRKAQKVLNLEADPRITCMLETGIAYSEVRGLVIRGKADVILDTPELVVDVQIATAAKRGEVDPTAPVPPPSEARLNQAAKRAVIRVRPTNIYSWDHSKLGGRY